MIKRHLISSLERLAKTYPVVTLTGPRQSGKTTLVRSVFPKYDYVSLENLDQRQFAQQDPNGFLDRYQGSVIFDEVQRVPELFSYIQTKVDLADKKGQYILTGSQNFNLMENITQSLAGRTAILELLPFSLSEIQELYPASVDERLFTGFYPRIYDEKLNPIEAMQFYVTTYIERDVRQLTDIRDLRAFEQFLKICAAHNGQLINLTNLGHGCGVSYNTAKQWLSILEASYIISIIPPHFNNIKKRLVKSPKLYFLDSALAAFLLEIQSEKELRNHPLRGALFESMIVSDLIKQRLNRVRKSNVYFFRDTAGHEVDVILDHGQYQQPVEIKSGKTITQDMFSNLQHYQNINDNTKNPRLVYAGEESYVRQGIHITALSDIDFNK